MDEKPIVGQSRAVKAKLVGSDKDLDLALLKVDVGKTLPYMKLGDSEKSAVGH